MSWNSKTLWIAATVVVVLALAIVFMRGPEVLAVELVALHVAVRADGSGVARVGPLELGAGEPFEVLAVAEGRDWRGRPVFYTDAEALEIDGREVEPASLRPWSGSERVRLLWFSVEGVPPFAEVAGAEDLARLGYREVFRAEWPQAWTIPGKLDPTVENWLPGREEVTRSGRFGVQRFHARLEVFGGESEILPTLRLRSLGAADLERAPQTFPAVVAALPGVLGPLSRVFGLPQIEPAETAPAEVKAAVGERIARGLAFSRVPLLRAWLGTHGIAWAGLEWEEVDLEGGVVWGSQGDVLRAGSKVAFALRDEEPEGVLDENDLCLDFDRGATVRTLGEIFVGEGVIERAVAADLEAGRTSRSERE